MVERNATVSPWAILVVFGYPITETVFTIFRRKLKRQSTLNAPDQDHMHSMVFKLWRNRSADSLNLVHRNSISALIMLTPSVLCAYVGVTLSWSSMWSQVAYLAFFGLYSGMYITLHRFDSEG